MDPNGILAELLETAKRVTRLHDECSSNDGPGACSPQCPGDQAAFLASDVLALDKWLTNGGFPPARYSPAQHHAPAYGQELVRASRVRVLEDW